MKVQIEDVKYNLYNFGLGLYAHQDTIFKVQSQPNRVLPYNRRFQIAVTYEIDSSRYEIVRVEYSFFDWLSAIGGLGSIILAVSKLVSALDSPQRYVTSALIGYRSVGEERAFTPDEVRSGFFATSRAIMTTKTFIPECCKSKCGGTKARLLAEGYSGLQRSMHVHDLLK